MDYEDGGSWTVLDSQTNINTGSTYCFQLDLSALSSPPYNIGVRFTGGGSNTINIDDLTLTEYDCEVDIVDCDCDVVSASISPTGYDTDSGQYIYEFDADTEGLSDGQYRIKHPVLGCSSCFEIDSDLGCEYWLFKMGLGLL